jgi:hypothetical protein
MMDEILDTETKEETGQKYFRLRALIIWLSVLAIWVLFVVRSWGGATLVLLFATAGLSAYSLNGLVRLKGKYTLNLVFAMFSILWILYLFYGAFLNEGIPLNTRGLMAFSVVFGIYFVAYFFLVGRFSSKKNQTRK